MLTSEHNQKLKILIAESIEEERKMFGNMLGDEYDILEASDSSEAISMMDAHLSDIVMLLLAIDSQKTEGFNVLEKMNNLGWIDRIPVIVISSDDSSDLMQKAYDLGAADYISKNTHSLMIKKRIGNTIRFFAKQKSLLFFLEERNKVLQERNSRLVYTDDLTNCLNLEGFRQRVKVVLKMYPERQYAVWYKDIKHFKFINESFGYEEGNRLLRYWCEQVKSVMMDDEVLGRVSGDCFVALTRATSNKNMRRIFEDISDKVAHYFDDKDKSFKIEIYAGIYMLEPQDRVKMNIDQMIDQARVAQRTVKDVAGGGVALFDEEQWKKQWRSMAICNHLEEALENGEIMVHLQPQYNYITGSLIGAEALCRWNHSELGYISPVEFIPVLEETGQIFKLDYFVWEQCCALMRKWIDSGTKKAVSLSVNISRADLNSGDVAEAIGGLLKKYDLEPNMLRLEITESVYMDEPEQLINQVKLFKERGFTVEMDDFGSGFSSLNMLKNVPVDVLKIDFKFLHGAEEKTRSGIILSSILKMAHQMDMPVICEGVETQDQADFMKNIGCRLMQGYYFARPMRVELFEEEVLESQRVNDMPKLVGITGLAKLNELLDSNSSSSFIFNRCIGGAVLFEYYEGNCEAILANEAFFKTEGLDRNDPFHNINLLDYVGENKKGTKEAIERAIEKGEAVCEFSVSESGERMLAHFRHAAIAEHGNIIFASVENVTESHKMRNKLREINSELQTLIELIPCGVFRYEAEGKQEFDYVSRGMLDMLGFDDEEGFQKKYNNNFPDMVYEEDRERVLWEIDEQIKRGPYDYCEYRIETASGQLKKVLDKGHIVYGDDGKKYFYVVIIEAPENK